MTRLSAGLFFLQEADAPDEAASERALSSLRALFNNPVPGFVGVDSAFVEAPAVPTRPFCSMALTKDAGNEP